MRARGVAAPRYSGPRRQFFRELKRRNVYKVGVTYTVVGFVVCQVAEIAFPALRLPEWALDHLGTAVELDPRHAEARHRLYDACQATGRAERSLEEARAQHDIRHRTRSPDGEDGRG